MSVTSPGTPFFSFDPPVLAFDFYVKCFSALRMIYCKVGCNSVLFYFF